MSNLTVKGNTSGTGTVILEAPNTNSNRTITLPDATTTVVGTDTTQTLTNKTIDASQLTGNVPAAQITTALNASGSAPIYACRAWVNFNGTGTVAIRASGNVSSITDLATGTYRVNFATAMPDANYAVNLSGNNTSSFGYLMTVPALGTTPSASSFDIITSAGATGADLNFVYVTVFR